MTKINDDIKTKIIQDFCFNDIQIKDIAKKYNIVFQRVFQIIDERITKSVRREIIRARIQRKKIKKQLYENK